MAGGASGAASGGPASGGGGSGAVHVFLELEAGVVAPLTRPVFLLENPRSVVYTTPPVGAVLAIGGGVRFL